MSAAPIADESAARQLLGSLAQLERELVELGYTQRLDATDRVRDALRRLADAGPPAHVLDRAAGELGGCSSFDGVLVSRLRGRELTPVALWLAGGVAPEAALGRLAAEGLEPGSSEIAAVRGRRAVLADPAAGGPPPAPALRGALGWRGCALAAVALRGEVVALVHAGVVNGGRALAELDRELLGLFAAGLDGVLDRAALEQTLRRHRGALAAAGRFVERRLGADAEPTAVATPADVEPPQAAEPADAAERHDPLTSRELEVLSLLAQGRTNRGVADLLEISEGTVKYHVKNILRKLHARSRADAVARHLRAVQPAARP
jgi:DNA-binding CsgD family transcriptional regulator